MIRSSSVTAQKILCFGHVASVRVERDRLVIPIWALLNQIIVVSVDFDYIEDPECRGFFKNIATSWTLEGKEITALSNIAGALMRQSGPFQELLKVYGSPTPAGAGVSSVCSTLQ